MAEKKKDAAAEAETETVSKQEYDRLYAECQRVVAAYNKALGIIAGNYMEKVSRDIFAEVDKEGK